MTVRPGGFVLRATTASGPPASGARWYSGTGTDSRVEAGVGLGSAVGVGPGGVGSPVRATQFEPTSAAQFGRNRTSPAQCGQTSSEASPGVAPASAKPVESCHGPNGPGKLTVERNQMEYQMRADSVRHGQWVRRNVALYEGSIPIYVWLFVMANLPDGDRTELLLAPTEGAPTTSFTMDDDELLWVR